MRPLFTSQNAISKLPTTQHELESEGGSAITPRDTFMGRELPTADKPLRFTSEEYYREMNKLMLEKPGYSPEPYYQYMLLGLYPPGPYDDSPEGKTNADSMTRLIKALTAFKQFTALEELIQRCEPLRILPVDLDDLRPEQLTKFLAHVSTYHPELSMLKISAQQSAQSPQEIDHKVSLLKDFISRSTHLKAFTFEYVRKEFSLTVINAIASAHHLESLELDCSVALSDEAFDKLKTIIRNSPQLKCIGLSNDERSEESLLEFLLTLRACPQLEIITLGECNCHSEETRTQLSELIGKSTQLKQLSFDGLGIPSKEEQLPFLQAITNGLSENRSLNSISLKWESNDFIDTNFLCRVIQVAKHHPCLKQLALDRESTYQLPIIRALVELVEANNRIIDVGIRPADLAYYRDKLVLKQQWTVSRWGFVTKTSMSEETKKIIAEVNRTADLIEEKIARNKALASGEMAMIFSQAFLHSPSALPGTGHIGGDLGGVLTERVLALSPNLPHFQNTMVEVALSIDEMAKQEREKEKAPVESTNDQTIVLRNTTNNDTKPDS